MKIADSHIHCRFPILDDIYKMLNLMADIGVGDACVLSLPYRGVSQNLLSIYLKMKFNRMTMRAFGGLHITDRYCEIPCEVMAEKLLELGCDGIKIMHAPDLRKYTAIPVNDKKYEKMYAFLQERGTPVNMHVNDPRTFWQNGRYDSTFPSFDEVYAETLDVLDSFPKLNITFAHFFFLSDNPDEAVRVMEKYPNVHFDLTPGGEMFVNFSKNPQYWHDFFTHYSDRILFGTDSNSIKSCNKELNEMVYKALTNSREEFVLSGIYGRDWHLKGLELDECVVSKICHKNYYDFVGEVNPVNEKMFYECCRRVLDDIHNLPQDEYYVRDGELIPDLKKDPAQKLSTDFLELILSE